MIAVLRSILFNIAFFGSTLVLSFALLPSLLLPWPIFWRTMVGYFAFVGILEKYILGLTYVVKGIDHLPKEGGYIVAAKHQSAFETMKLPLLFDRPVVIVKKELLNIPFWGWYAARSGMIGINRKRPAEARQQMIDGAKKALAQGRPVIVFPQGTRVAPHETTKEKPYRRGIADLYLATNAPVIPMALNAGAFWPRNAFFKRPGVVTIEFLPAIPRGLTKGELMQKLEDVIETNSARLVQEVLPAPDDQKVLVHDSAC